MRRAEQAIPRTYRSVPHHRPICRVEWRLVADGEVGTVALPASACRRSSWHPGILPRMIAHRHDVLCSEQSAATPSTSTTLGSGRENNVEDTPVRTPRPRGADHPGADGNVHVG